MQKGKLTAFFYLLLRDHLTAGELDKLMEEVNEANHETFENPKLEDMAVEYADGFDE